MASQTKKYLVDLTVYLASCAWKPHSDAFDTVVAENMGCSRSEGTVALLPELLDSC